jgi:hypothetical protein
MSKRGYKNLYQEATRHGLYAEGDLVKVKCPRCQQWAAPNSSTFYRNHGKDKCEEVPEDSQHLEGRL